MANWSGFWSMLALGLLSVPSTAPASDPLPFSRDTILKRFDQDGDGQLNTSERNWLRKTYGGIDVPMLPWPPADYRQIDWPAHFVRAGIDRRDRTPDHNPLSDHGAVLGRVLFYDRHLSRNNTIACASCHQQQAGFADPRRFSVGFDGRETSRNAMGLVNLRYTRFRGSSPGFFWDERAGTLEEQVLMPIQNELEMGLTLDELEGRLSSLPYYPPLFEAAFGSGEVTRQRIARALAQFLRAIVSTQSRFDRAAARADDLADDFADFTPLENEGKRLFFEGPGGVAEFACAMCHEPPTFNMAEAMNIGLERQYADPGLGALDRPSRDPFSSSNEGKFKAPSLRNVALTAPYMHDGRFATLEEVVEHYSAGVQAHPALNLVFAEPLSDDRPSGFRFTRQEKAALVAFLQTLTDERLVSDERFSDPFIRP